MAVTDLPIIGYYDQQRFKQFNPSDCANWYMVPSSIGKKKVAMYPVLGRRHIHYLNQNRLIFENQPRAIWKSNNYWYAVVDDKILRIDEFFNQVEITSTVKLVTLSGDVFFDFIVVGDPTLVGSTTYVGFTDGQHLYIYKETTDEFGIVTDSHAPLNPLFIATFGNRFVVSGAGSSTFVLSQINLGGTVAFAAILSDSFNVPAVGQLFAQEVGAIRQMGVLQNTLYIFTDFSTGIWSNIKSSFISSGGTETPFPWKKNTTYDFNEGIGDPNSLSIDFGMMVWESRNRNGLLQIVMTDGGKPKPISSKAVDVLFQRIANTLADTPGIRLHAEGFLYDYENTIFYRISGGMYQGTSLLDQIGLQFSLEYNFETETWHRVIEANGERNRIEEHVFFANRHLVSVQGDNTVYELSGQFYNNESQNPLQPDHQADDAYTQDPFRYERVTPIICAGLIDILAKAGAAFYDEFITNYVEIDFVWGEDTFINSLAPFENAVYVVAEEPDADGNPIFIVSDEDPNQYVISEIGNTPVLNSPTYNNWFKPHIELLFSNDGGISFQSADVREFSQVGVFQWRMRWYQLGTSRNRVYKLICVSPSPIVILGANMDVRRSSGGAS